MKGEKIAYQNKDITSKFLAERLKGKSFRVYGLDLPEIKEVRPTNIPVVKANELRLDNLFELEDGSVALVDYESDYDEADKIKSVPGGGKGMSPAADDRDLYRGYPAGERFGGI